MYENSMSIVGSHSPPVDNDGCFGCFRRRRVNSSNLAGGGRVSTEPQRIQHSRSQDFSSDGTSSCSVPIDSVASDQVQDSPAAMLSDADDEKHSNGRIHDNDEHVPESTVSEDRIFQREEVDGAELIICESTQIAANNNGTDLSEDDLYYSQVKLFRTVSDIDNILLTICIIGHN